MPRKNKDIAVIGKKFNRLTIVSNITWRFPLPTSKYIKAYVTVQCECGVKKEVQYYPIIYGHLISCGCYKSQQTSARNITHGLNTHPLVSVWNNMKSRCYNRRNKQYHNYGGKGVFICDEWRNDFKAFHDWAIANGWKKGLQIDRIDNSGGYEISNCRFVLPMENTQNKDNTKLSKIRVKLLRKIYPFWGKTHKEIANLFGVTRSCISYAIRNDTWLNA